MKVILIIFSVLWVFMAGVEFVQWWGAEGLEREVDLIHGLVCLAMSQITLLQAQE